jgi:hypothetical protein
MLVHIRILCPAILVWLLAVEGAHAQVTKGGPSPTTLPAPGAVQQLTPEQVRDILWLRALQNRRRGQVRTGVPQFVPFGNPWSFGTPMQPSAGADQQARKQTSAQRRAEARAAREEEKRAEREKAKAKREAAAKARAEAKANAKPKDEQVRAE